MLLVSLVAYAPAPRELVVVTDRPDRFDWFGNAIRVVTLDRRELEAWRGVPPISMRIKLEVIRANWPDSGAVALVDADVLAREPLATFEARLQRRRRVHAQARIRLRPLEAPRQSRALERAARPLVRWLGGSRWRRDVEFRRARGACRGPCAVRSDAAVLRRHGRRRAARHFATEQLVEGVVLGRTGRLRPAAPWFTHYWGNKPAHTAAIDARLGRRPQRRSVRRRMRRALPAGSHRSAVRSAADAPERKIARWLSRQR